MSEPALRVDLRMQQQTEPGGGCEPVAQVALYIAKEASFVVTNSTLHDDRKGKIVGISWGARTSTSPT